MSTGPVTVAHVITRLDVGGAQATAVRTCALLDPSRYRPLLLTGGDAGSGGSLVTAAEDAGIEVVRIPSLVSAVRPSRDLLAVRDLCRVIRSRQVALVHTHSSKAGALGRAAAGRTGRPKVHTVHGWSFHDGQPAIIGWVYRSVERHFGRRTDALVVVTPADREIGLGAGIGRPEQYHLVRSGIALPPEPSGHDRGQARAVLGWESDHVGLVAVGRLAKQKDPPTLIGAFARVAALRPGARLALIGDGDLRPDVEALVARHGLGRQVQLLGIRSDVVDLLAGADAFVSSSLWEGLPRTVLEAIAVGVPVVATDVGGIRDVIEPDRTGLLVPSGDPSALAAALVEVIDQPQEARSRAVNARSALDEFDEARMAERTMTVYDQVMASRSLARSGNV